MLWAVQDALRHADLGWDSLGTKTADSSGDMDNIFPRYRFFPTNGGADMEYTGPVTADAMTLYLKKELPRTGKLG